MDLNIEKSEKCGKVRVNNNIEARQGMENQIMTDEQRHKMKELQSLYYAFNARPDTITKLYDNKVILEMSDISNLESMINEKLALHQREGQVGRSYVTVVTDRHKIYNFDNFKLFKEHDWKINESIENITLVWDFYIVVDSYENPQRHKLTVKLSSGLRPEEVLNLIFSGKIEDMQEMETQQATIIAQMDFIEHRLGQEFLNIVDEWVRSLRTHNEKNRCMLWLKKKRKVVAYFVNYVLFFVSILTFLIGFNVFTKNFNLQKISEFTINNFNYCVNYIVISIIVCCIILNRGESVAQKIFRRLTEYGDDFIFNITNKDRKKYETVSRIEQKNVMHVVFDLLFSLILNVICGIIASIMYSKL